MAKVTNLPPYPLLPAFELLVNTINLAAVLAERLHKIAGVWILLGRLGDFLNLKPRSGRSSR
jgi:hypothetical protein